MSAPVSLPAPGETLDIGPILVSETMITAWARAFDPLPFHLDRKAARASLLGDLAASGWQTLALGLRLLKESPLGTLPILRLTGTRDLKWLKPVLVDDRLSGTATLVRLEGDRAEIDLVLENQKRAPVLKARLLFEVSP